MSGAPSPARIQTFFLGFHDPSGATGPLFGADDVADDDQGRAIFGVTGRVLRVILNVVETQSAHTESVVLNWRPVPGSGSFTALGTYVVPASISAGTVAIADLTKPTPNTATTIGTTEAYGIAGSYRYEGDASVYFGPGGEFQLTDTGSSTAGQYNVSLEVELVSHENSPQTITALAVS